MNTPNPNIRINVDPANPGQFFACCGLLELAHRRWPGTEGWFEQRQFCLAGDGTPDQLLDALADCHMTDTMTDAQHTRFKEITAMSVKNRKAIPGVEDEAKTLDKLLREAHIVFGSPFSITLDWFLPGSDWVLRQYIEPSAIWSTVTPVILPGYDDPDHLHRKLNNCQDADTQKRYLAKLDARIDALLRKAFVQAGYATELVQQLELDWRGGGFRAGVELASRYLPPENLNNSPRYHVKVRFPSAVQGPIAVGGGRFRGMGLFATHPE
jgi:hypothetical protein